MPGSRSVGMDQDYYDWSPIVTRPVLRWPGGARVALCVILCLEHYEWGPPTDGDMAANFPGGVGRRPFPDNHHFSRREYGNRVGIFRVMDVLDKYGIRATVAMDATVAQNYPYVVQECLRRGWEFIGHGISVNRMITSNMSEEEEQGYIRTALSAVEQAVGRRPTGWLGPEYGESTRTPALLAKEGIRYVCDWPNDEQPYRMKVPQGTMVSLPVMLDLDDTIAHWERHIPIEGWARMVGDAFDVMYKDGGWDGRLLVLNLHPWLIGQPHRVPQLDAALAHICRRAKVWKATGEEIVTWYLDHS